jgi:Flp pilus assembly pilin Flp
MNKIKNTIKHLIQDESGQGATEYILLLVVVVAIAVMFKDKIMGIVQGKIGEIGGAISGFSIGGGG